MLIGGRGGSAGGRSGHVLHYGYVDRVKVSFVSSHAQLGGSEKVLENILAGVDPSWIHDIVSLQDGPFVERFERYGATALLHTRGNKTSILRNSLRLRRRLRKTRPDLVHANGLKAALMAVVATLGTETPILWLKTDTSFEGRIARAVASRCGMVVGNSRAVVETIDHLPNVEVSYPGVEPPAPLPSGARTSLLSELGIDEHAQLVVLAGRLHRTKGHSELLEALPEVLVAHPEALALLVGPVDPSQPSYSEELRKRAGELEVEDRVLFLGHRDDVREVIAVSDVLVVPSIVDDRGTGKEGFGLVAVEALLAGTPVVAYAHGSLPEVLGDAGLLVAPGDRSGLAQAVNRLLSDPSLRSRLTAAGKERGRGFSLERFVADMQQYYRRVAATAASKRRNAHGASMM